MVAAELLKCNTLWLNRHSAHLNEFTLLNGVQAIGENEAFININCNIAADLNRLKQRLNTHAQMEQYSIWIVERCRVSFHTYIFISISHSLLKTIKTRIKSNSMAASNKSKNAFFLLEVMQQPLELFSLTHQLKNRFIICYVLAFPTEGNNPRWLITYRNVACV